MVNKVSLKKFFKFKSTNSLLWFYNTNLGIHFYDFFVPKKPKDVSITISMEN